MLHLSTAVARAGFDTLNGVVRPLVKRGLGSPPPVGVGTVIVSTTGRRTGVQREVPLVGARVGDTVVVSTARGNSQWLRNVEADPEVRVWIDGQERSGVAEVRRSRGLDVATIRLTRDRGSSHCAARSKSSAA